MVVPDLNPPLSFDASARCTEPPACLAARGFRPQLLRCSTRFGSPLTHDNKYVTTTQGTSRRGCFGCLTFELRRDQRQDARPGLVKMYRVPPARAWWPAVGPRLERGVRQHCAGATDLPCMPIIWPLHRRIDLSPRGTARVDLEVFPSRQATAPRRGEFSHCYCFFRAGT